MAPSTSTLIIVVLVLMVKAVEIEAWDKLGHGRQPRYFFNFWPGSHSNGSKPEEFGRSETSKKYSPPLPPPPLDLKFKVKRPPATVVAASTRPTTASHFLQLALANLREELKRLNSQHVKLEEDSKRLAVKSCSKCDTFKCGTANEGPDVEVARGGRIINGSLVTPHQFPWMASVHFVTFAYGGREVGPDVTFINLNESDSRALKWTVRFVCGGTLINPQYVLTAAHCLFKGRNSKQMPIDKVRVKLGGHRMNDGLSYRVVSATVHPGYHHVRGDFNHDVALLRLNGAGAHLDHNVKPICLLKSDEEIGGTEATILGWGHTKPSGSRAEALMRLDLPVLTREKCLKDSNYDEEDITDNMVCAGFIEGGKDACIGDSGGGMIRRRSDGAYELIGIVSWGQRCAAPGYPGVYAKLGSHLGWLSKATEGSCFCH